MLTRRELLIAAAAGIARAAAPQPRTAVTFSVPPGSCDCAAHVFGDPARFPFAEGRRYTPESASMAELRMMLKALRLDRVVLVQATPYGTDNSRMLDALRQLGGMARGGATIGENTPEAALDEMHRAGVRGIRLPLGSIAASDPAEARRRLRIGFDRVKSRKNWHVQITAAPATFEILRDDLMAAPATLVVDHFGEIRGARGVEQPGFPSIVALVKAGKAYVKISHADNLSSRPDMSDMAPFAAALIAADPRRILWGTHGRIRRQGPPRGAKRRTSRRIGKATMAAC